MVTFGEDPALMKVFEQRIRRLTGNAAFVLNGRITVSAAGVSNHTVPASAPEDERYADRNLSFTIWP